MDQFPELTTTVSNNTNNNLDYKKVVNKVNTDLPKISSEKVIPGWTTFNKKTKEVITYDNYGNKVDKSLKLQENDITSNQIYSVYEKMSKRWCDYYDSVNDLIGDRSPYINYKYDIQKLVEEDDEMFKNMYENLDDDLSSDDEYNNFAED